jgi:hypothetical protein
VTEEILAEIGKVILVKENLLFAEAGTPLTYERYIGKRAVGGFPLTVRNAKKSPVSTSAAVHYRRTGLSGAGNVIIGSQRLLCGEEYYEGS